MLPPAAGRAEVDTRPPGCEPPGRGHAVDRAGALTIDDRAVPGGLGGRPDHRQEAGPARWATLVERTTRYLVLVGLPQGPGGPTWCGRPHPPHPRTARRRDEHPDLGPGERNGPPPAPGAPPSPATNPYPGAIANEPGNRPRTTPDNPNPTRSIHPTHCHLPLTPPRVVKYTAVLSSCQLRRQRRAFSLHKFREARLPMRIRNWMLISYYVARCSIST